jgi:tetratricopeptide (TPR) repeat protein
MIVRAALLVLLTASSWSQETSAPQKVTPAPRASGPVASKASSFEQLSHAAERARNENRNDEAIHLYQQALELRPTWPEGLWYLSTLFYEKERFVEARDHLRRFLTVDPQTGPAWALLGMSEFQTREYTRSLDHLQRSMSLGLGDRKEMAQSVFYFVAVLRTRFELYTDSMNLLMAMVKSGQPTDLLIEPLGLAALRLPFLPAEIPADRRELVRLAGQAALAIEAQRQEDAEKLFMQMVTKYPDEPGVHFLYGAYLMDQRPDEGMREMKRELEISPSNVPARLRIAEQHIKEERPVEALQLAQQAIALEPTSSTARLILGESLIAAGDSAKGIAELEKARDAAPDRVRTHWDLLRAYTAAGRPEDAKREKEAIEKLNTQTSQP